MKKIVSVFLCLIFLSCDDTQQVESLYSEALTVEGYVTEGEFVKVYLTSNLPFQGEIAERDLLIAEEGRAKVVVSDGIEEEILTLTRDDSRYPNLYYQTKRMKGRVGVKYNLTVNLKGVTYFAETTVPSQPIVKSIAVINGGKEGDRAIQIKMENSTEIEYYKVLIKNRIEESYSWANPYLFSTELANKEEDLNLVLKYSEYVGQEEINKLYFLNTYDIELVKIAKAEYEFFKSAYGDVTTLLITGTFAENIESNIQGGNNVLGFWTGENRLEFEVEIN
ncbi:hypothetical protein [Wenyingzhuangia sp. IMCC45574]